MKVLNTRQEKGISKSIYRSCFDPGTQGACVPLPPAFGEVRLHTNKDSLSALMCLEICHELLNPCEHNFIGVYIERVVRAETRGTLHEDLLNV
jgi:hypothetical protein